MVLGVFIQVLYFKMWLWILIGLGIITKVHGYASGSFPQACESMLPVHPISGLDITPQNTPPPFEVSYRHGKEGEPITVELRSKQSTPFKGFMLEARETGMVDGGQPVGRFIKLDSRTRLLKCSGVADSAVSQSNNQRKTNIQVHWTSPGEELNITFRATFVQSYSTFWEQVDVTVTLPTPPPSTTTSATEPGTTTSATEPSTTASATEPGTTTSATEPGTTTSATEPSTTASATEPSTTASATEPSTTASATEPSTTASATEPSTTASATEPSTTASATESSTTSTTTLNPQPTSRTLNLKRAATVLMMFDLLFVGLKLELPNIVTTTVSNSLFRHCLSKELKISCSLFCVAVEISAAVLFCVGDSCKGTLFALVCVAIAINFIELIIVSLPIGPSHELKEICDLAVKVCSAIHTIFTTAVVFIGVLEIDNCSEKRNESWLLKTMVAYTAWIFLFVIWVYVFSTHRIAILGRSKTGSAKNSGSWRQKQKKKTLSAAEAIVTAVSVIFIVGHMSFVAAVIVGIFGCQEK